MVCAWHYVTLSQGLEEKESKREKDDRGAVHSAEHRGDSFHFSLPMASLRPGLFLPISPMRVVCYLC